MASGPCELAPCTHRGRGAPCTHHASWRLARTVGGGRLARTMRAGALHAPWEGGAFFFFLSLRLSGVLVWDTETFLAACLRKASRSFNSEGSIPQL